jgi:hypothetical protein
MFEGALRTAADLYVAGGSEFTGNVKFLGTPYTRNYDGFDFALPVPGDHDIDLLSVIVGGNPVLKWDESGDRFSFNKGINVTGNILASGLIGIGNVSLVDLLRIKSLSADSRILSIEDFDSTAIIASINQATNGNSLLNLNSAAGGGRAAIGSINGDYGQLQLANSSGIVTVDIKGDSGNINSLGANLDGAVVINESGTDNDTRIEGNTDANLLFVDASADRVGIGTAIPTEKLTVKSPADNNDVISIQDHATTNKIFSVQQNAIGCGAIILNNNTGSGRAAIGSINGDYGQLQLANSSGIVQCDIKGDSGNIDSEGTVDAAGGAKFGGASFTKKYPYQITITDYTIGHVHIVLSPAVTLAKVVGFTAIGYDYSGGAIYSNTNAATPNIFYLNPAIDSTTQTTIYFGGGYRNDDVISIIIEETV